MKKFAFHSVCDGVANLRGWWICVWHVDDDVWTHQLPDMASIDQGRLRPRLANELLIDKVFLLSSC